MRARIITLANNFYQDEENKSEITDWKKELEEYCCLGYFDALGVQKIDGSSQEIRDCVHRISVERLKGNCSRRNVVCISSNVSKDDAFWERAHGQPCLFVSLIRVKRDMEKVQDLQKIINEINRKEDMIAYYTYDHSEVVVVKSDSGYLDGMKSVLSLYQYMDIFKMYSVFAVKEEELDLCRGIKEEEVDCLLSALVKDRTKVEGYIENLERFLGETPGLSERFSITSVDTLGKCDLLVEICNVSLRRLLRAYKMGGLLTHTNSEYRKVFFNIESQLFSCVGRRRDGAMDN